MAVITTDPSGTTNGTADADAITGAGTIFAGAGNDTVNGVSDAIIYGQDGDDHLYGSGYESGVILDGGPGDDTLEEASSGSATVAYYDATGGVTVDIGVVGPQTIGGGEGVDTLIKIGGVIGSPFDDVIRGAGGNDYLYGGAGADLIEGRDGDDLIIASVGGDTIDGGDGRDQLRFDGAGYAGPEKIPTATGPLHIDLNDTGPQDVGGGFGVMAIRNVEDIIGGAQGNVFVGSDRAEEFYTTTGDNTLYGGGGDDVIVANHGHNLLRGGTGDDVMIGGQEFDDMLGNQGADTMEGANGDDWVVGGQDNDKCSGGAGNDIVYGNLGADTLTGDAGDDIVRGGQGNDIVDGGAGDDFVSGDRGDDTLRGGAGADRFYDFTDGGYDRVLDFNRAEGDRVEIETGDDWSVTQIGADTFITVGGSATLVLVGVAMSSLTGDWIYSGVG